MYTIERGKSAWLCTTAIEAFELDAVSLRLQGELKNFNEFQLRLTKGEKVGAGVIQVYKCSEVTECKDCTKYKGCKILQAVVETAQAHSDFAKFVQANNGYTI